MEEYDVNFSGGPIRTWRCEDVEIRPIIVSSDITPGVVLSLMFLDPMQPSLYAKAYLEGSKTEPDQESISAYPINDMGDMLVNFERYRRYPVSHLPAFFGGGRLYFTLSDVDF